MGIFDKIIYFCVFYGFFSEMALCRELRFFALQSVHQNASFRLSNDPLGWFSFLAIEWVGRGGFFRSPVLGVLFWLAPTLYTKKNKIKKIFEQFFKRWHCSQDIRHVTCDPWHVTNGQVPSLYSFGVRVFWKTMAYLLSELPPLALKAWQTAMKAKKKSTPKLKLTFLFSELYF